MLVAEPKIPVIAMRGPRVRIHLPPAKSLQTISSSAAGPITARRCGPREAIRQRVDFVGAHRVLTAAGMAGDTEVGAAALQELRRAQPRGPSLPGRSTQQSSAR